MQKLKATIGIIFSIITMGLSIAGVMPPNFYLAFGLVFGLVVGISEYSTFMLQVKRDVYEKNNLNEKPSPFLYAPIAAVNVLFWGFTLSMYLMNGFNSAIIPKHE